MPGFNPDNINIHDLTIEEPEKEAELPFDVERDITQEDWTMIDNLLQREKRYGNWAGIFNYLKYIKIVNPQRPVGFSKGEMEENIKEQVERFKGDQYVSMLASLMATAKMLDCNIDSPAQEKILDSIREKIKKNIQKKDWNSFLDNLISLNITDPTKMDFEEKELEDIRSGLEDCRAGKMWENFSSVAGAMKIIGLDVNVDETSWRGMKENLQHYREKSSSKLAGSVEDGYKSGLFRLSANMRFIGAEKVNVVENNFEFVMPKEKELLQSEPKELPQSRKF